MDMTIADELAAETLAERRAALAAQLAEVDAKLDEIARAEEARIEEERAAEKASAISNIRAEMQMYRITVDDLAGKPVTRAARGEPRPSALTGTKVAPKYRDPATGETWSGRGLQPKWLKAAIAGGAELESFRVGGAA